MPDLSLVKGHRPDLTKGAGGEVSAAIGRIKIKAQLMIKDEIAFGPGKADLLDSIREAGSISGGARLMGLSYRRAWLMVEIMNRLFDTPLVTTRPGGRGGASITASGKAVLADYRALQAELEKVAARTEERWLARLNRLPV